MILTALTTSGMAVTILGFKRKCRLQEELLLLDPHQMKRCRFDALIELPRSYHEDALPEEIEEALANAVARAASASASAAATASSSSSMVGSGHLNTRRRNHEDMEDDSEFDGGLPPAEKRFRSMTAGSSADCSTDNVEVRPWVETVVRALHGCPSVDVAVQRCSKVLGDFKAEVSQVTAREVQQVNEAAAAAAACQAGAEPQDEVTYREMQSLKHTNQVFRRAVFHLAERCRKVESGAQEVTSLRQQLEQSLEVNKRLQHSNEVLQSHLRVQMDYC